MANVKGVIPSASPAQINAMQRTAVLSKAVEMQQTIFNQTYTALPGAPINIPLRNVGLVKKLIVEITAQFNNTDGANAATLTDFGVANLLAGVNGMVLTDLNNNVRIQTSGWHMAFLNTLRQQYPTDATISNGIISSAFGNNFACILAPATINANSNANIRMVWEVPLAYSDEDLRGAMYMNVINAIATLQLQLNQAPSVAAATDSTLAIYKGCNTSTLTNIVVQVDQVYLDQLPVGKNGVILPEMDLSTVYEVKNTSLTAITNGQDFPVAFANFRDFLSVFAVYNSNPAADAGRTGGTDVNYWSLTSANFTNIYKLTARMMANRVRRILNLDFPNGVYYHNFRKAPISTVTFGNMNLNLNPSTAAANAYLLIGWEDFALTNTLSNAGSLV